MGYREFSKILIIDGDVDNHAFIKEALNTEFMFYFSNCGKEGLRLAKINTPDLILLEITLPKIEGVEICDLLRRNEATRHIPIIAITKNSDFELQLLAFSLGADDFLQKPFRPQELAARIHTKIRRIDEFQKQSTVLAVGDMKLDLDRFECRIRDKVVIFSVLEFKLLRYFVENVNRVLSRERILHAVWRGNHVTARTIDVHMSSLRKKVKDSNFCFSTLYGAGYILKSRECETLAAS